MNILIIGAGIVGQTMHKTFSRADLHDPALGIHAVQGKRYNVAFVCVPTPMGEGGACDVSIVEQAVRENDADVFVIKSTVPPGTTRRLAEAMRKTCVFSPEFTGMTQHSVAVDDGFVILGGERAGTDRVAELYKAVKSATFRIFKTTAETAELVKYAENAYLATKVVFFAEFYRLCEMAGVDVDEFREALLLDPRIGREHSFIYRDHPFYKSKCFDKDLPALVAWAKAQGAAAPLIEAVIAVNGQHKADQP